MGNVNRGKQFETQVKKGFEKNPTCSIDRLPDQMNGFAGGSNICDFIVYKQPHLLYLECKSCYGNTLNFHSITDAQWKGLLNKSKIQGVKAGVMIWFVDKDLTVYVPIQELQSAKERGLKSVNATFLYEYPNNIEIDATKRQVLFDYSMENFWKKLMWKAVLNYEL